MIVEDIKIQIHDTIIIQIH